MAGAASALRDKPQCIQHAPAIIELDHATRLPLGVLWIMFGLCSYGVLSVASRYLFHSEDATQQWRAEVPLVVYDRSMFMFATAFCIDVLTVGFEFKTSRLDMVLLPAFIKGMATLTNSLVRYGWATIGAGPGGSMVMVQRYICWMHTTPTILLLVKLISTNITKQQVIRAICCVEVMLLTGAAGALCSGWVSMFWGVVSHLAFLPLIPYLHQGLKEAGCVVNLHAAGYTMTLVYYITMMMWTTFGLVWDLRMLGFIDTGVEEVVYLCCDFSAKVMFSSGLMLSSFKGMDSRREEVMRQIQETHRQTLIQELRRVIEQKDAFMSSVSHELRTPLNGIIGISEGLLSGCCGVLNESVRRQIYIVRTSGARLLALINDVMDAAALRQHRLVLKQERLDLRQVVGDVTDLTRSLVDNDVSLKNDVPEGMVVWADSGRVIQVLNNLLGNAAKFTHQGSIRVTADWYDAEHQWVVVHVTDTGIGIPKHKLASIFLPFEQVDGSISRQYGGFGLGLSITQELVKAHGGELWVKSREGKGSSFTFTLPSHTGQTKQSAQQPAAQQAGVDISAPMFRASSLTTLSAAAQESSQRLGSLRRRDSSATGLADLDTDSCIAEEYTRELPYDAAQLAALASSKPLTASSAAAVTGSSSIELDGNRSGTAGANKLSSAPSAKRDPRPTQFARTGRYQILSVDDDEVNQTVIQSLLSSTGYEVVRLSSGTQMLEYIDKCEVLPDLILLDVMMPDMSGPEVLAQLAKRTTTLTAPIILVSAHTEEAMVVKGLDSGADDYISKPFKRAEFLARIRAKLQLSSGVVEQVYGGPADEGDPLVMCVDDDEMNHIVLEGMLQSQDYRYIKARSGAEALQLLDEAGNRPPHLVLLDASLPDTTGLDVLQQLRSRFSQVALPVVMLTARHNERAIVQALDSGANDYATKPFRRSELLARIRMHLRSSQRAAAVAAEGPPVSPVAAALAQAEQDTALELKQAAPAAEHLKAVPLLVAQLSGLEEVTAGLTPEQLSVLLGTIADTFDAVVEKYAMLKVEASDNCLTVAAPLSSSADNSARSSLQQDRQPVGSAQVLHSTLDSHMRCQLDKQQPLQTAIGAEAARLVCPLGTVLQQLLKLSEELMQALDSTYQQNPVSSSPADGQLQRSGSAGVTSCSPRNPVEALLPESCRGVLHLRVALHVGELHAGVVGARRPRYRLLGPALQVVKQAAAAAPDSSITATDTAAEQLRYLGTCLRRVEVHVVWPDGTGSPSGGKHLWLYEAADCAASDGPVMVTAAAAAGRHSTELPISCGLYNTHKVHQAQEAEVQDSKRDMQPSAHGQSRLMQHSQPQSAKPVHCLPQDDFSALLASQQQQLASLMSQLSMWGGTYGSAAQLSSASLEVPGWCDGLAAYGWLSAPWVAAAVPQGAVPGRKSGSWSSASGGSNSSTPPGRSCSNTSSAADGSYLAISGITSGHGVGAAEAEFASALGALAGWQLGPAELQQILLLQQELEAMQQQLASIQISFSPCTPAVDCQLNGICKLAELGDRQASCNGNRAAQYKLGNGLQPLHCAGKAGEPGLDGLGCTEPTSGTNPVRAAGSSDEGDANVQSNSGPGQLMHSPQGGRADRRSTLGRLFRRKSHEKRRLSG